MVYLGLLTVYISSATFCPSARMLGTYHKAQSLMDVLDFQVGMSGGCYPDNLIGNIPNLYYYAANNPSEATIAKRRSYANTISYLTPPAENAGLYKGLKELKELISSYQVCHCCASHARVLETVVSVTQLGCQTYSSGRAAGDCFE
jgi:hypothetical protein